MQCYGVRRDKLTAKRGQDLLLLLLLYCQLQFCVRSCRGVGGVRGLKAPGLTMTSSLLANYFGVRWRTHFVMNRE